MTASVTAGDRNTVTYANDTDRSLVNSVTDAKGVATGYSYDSMRRLLATACGDAAVTNGYTDDLLSSLSHTNTSGKTTTYSFIYGAADLQTAVNIGSRNLVSNAYNSGTWTLSSQTYGNGDYWKYFYDNMDTLTSRFTNCSDTEGIGFYYTYNGKGKLVRIEMKSVTIADGAVTGGTLLSSENYLYDGSDRLIRVVETDGDNVVLHDFSWTYDAKDNVTALTESIGGKSFSYTYAYDDDSRPTTFGYGDVTEQVTYDGHGRSSGTTVKNGSSTVLGTGYAYRDVDSTYTTTQVKSVTNSYGGKTANFNYTYDANGNILSVSGAQTAVYEYDDLGQLITETIGTGYDQVIIRYTYDAWGKLLTSAGDMADVNPLRYRGYYYDAETSLYYLQSRYYDPEVCRFINTDSFATTDIDGVLSANMFAYCENNPVINEDPTGAIALTTLILIGSAVFGVATALYTGYEMRQAGYGWDDTIFYSLGAGICAFGTVYTLGSSLYSLYCSMSWYYGYAPITEIGTKNNSIPQEAYDTYEYVTSHNGTPKNGYKGGSTYANDGRAGSAVLPEEYAPFREYDIYPKIKNVSRGTERIVISDTGSSAWYTSDHYKTFVRLLTK